MMPNKRVRRPLLAAIALLALAGCEAVPAADAAATASSEAVSSRLANASTVPITYTGSDPNKELTLAPGDKVALPGGAWAVPRGWLCSWRFADTGETQTAGSPDFTTWTTFGGYDETVTSCTGPAS